jgi:hypothetical protein
VITVARITPLAEAAAGQPVTAMFAAFGFLVFCFCLIAAAPYVDRWVEARLAAVGTYLGRHARRIRHGLGADDRRINDWADEIAPRPDGPA